MTFGKSKWSKDPNFAVGGGLLPLPQTESFPGVILVWGWAEGKARSESFGAISFPSRTLLESIFSSRKIFLSSVGGPFPGVLRAGEAAGGAAQGRGTPGQAFPATSALSLLLSTPPPPLSPREINSCHFHLLSSEGYPWSRRHARAVPDLGPSTLAFSHHAQPWADGFPLIALQFPLHLIFIFVHALVHDLTGM